MLFCFYLICLAFCDETSTKICLYSTNLPDACKGIISLDISTIDDLDSKIESIKANKMILLFEPKINYKLKISTFSKTSVNFTSLSQNSEKYNLDLTVDKYETESSKMQFEDCSLHFIGQSTALKFDWIEIYRCDIKFDNIENKITAQAAAFDSSFSSFSEITIEGGHRNPDFTINTTETLAVELKEYENIINSKTRVIYTNPTYRDIEIVGSQKLSFYCSTDNEDKLSVVSLRDIEELTFNDSSIEFPTEYIMTCQNIHNIHAIETSVPVTLLQATTDQYYFTNIYANYAVEIVGNIECNVAFIKEEIPDDIQDRISVQIKGTVSSQLFSVNSSFFDIEILNLNIEMNKYIGFDPFIHCIGKGGVSCITAFTDYEGFIGFSRPLFNRDFDSFLNDGEISDYLDTELNYLEIKSNTLSFESFEEPQMTFVNESFIHGFTKDDSVVNIFRSSVNPLQDTVIISSPSLKTLKLCYNSDCPGGLKVSNEDLKKLQNNIIFKGMQNVVLESSSDIEIIDFTNLYENLNFSVSSTSNDYIKITSMTFNSNLLINYTFQSVKLPSFSVDLANVTFYNCSFISDTDKITTTAKSNVQIDSDFVKKGYLTSHFQDGNEINQLSIQINSFTEIHMIDSGFILVGANQGEEFTISQTKTKWTSILFKEDVFISDTLSLFANSKNPSFNLEIQTSKKNDEVFSLKLENWSQIKESSLITVDHSSLPLQIVLTEPQFILPILLNGNGKVIYSHKYSLSGSICACENPDKIDSFPNCKNSSKIVTFSELNENIKNPEFDDLTVIVAGSSKDDSKHPTIDMESLNRKVVNFKTEGESQEYITLNSESQLKEPKLSETYFNNFIITAKSGSQSNEFVFGELSFISSSLEGFDQSTFRINSFVCETTILNSLKELYITDDMIITGDFDVTEKTIHFDNDANAEDLKAFLLKNTNVVLGNGKVKIGKITFLIDKSENFDIVLNINSNSNISFECEESSSFEKIPPIQVNPCKNIVFDFSTNSENWPAIQKDSAFLINFVDLINATLILKHQQTPIQIESISGFSKIISKASSVGITGQISTTGGSELKLSFEKLVDGKCEIQIDEMTITDDFTFSILQANLSVIVTSFNSNKDKLDKLVTLELYLGLYGLSTFQVKFIEEEIKFFPTVYVLLDIPSSVKLDSPELDAFCSKNYTLIKSPIEQDPDFTLDIIDPLPETHGLTTEAFAIEQDKYSKATNFYTKLNPREVPLSICYNAMQSCEVSVKDDQLSDLTNIIPSGLKAVEFKVGKDIKDNLYINLDLPVFNGMSATISSDNLNTVNVHLGKDKIKEFKIDMTTIADMTEGSYHVNKLIISSSLIKTIEGFDEVEIMDSISWSYNNFDKFSGKISFPSFCSQIIFESDGWKLEGDPQITDKISSSNFPNLEVVVQNTNQLAFQLNSENIVPLKIKVDSSINTFSISKNWSKLKSFKGLVIENISQDSQFNVQTSSFPFPIYPLNISQSEKQIIIFEEDIEISQDKISLKNENLNIDNSKVLATINEIEFDENSVFNNSSPININTLSTKQGNFSRINKATIYQKLKIIGESEIEGQIDFDSNEANEIEFTWDLNETPELLFTEFPQTAVKVNVRFARESISKDEIPVFNDFLYQKAFRLGNFGEKCNAFNDNLQYTSTYKYFNGADSIFDSYCNDGELIIHGRRKIPTGDDPTLTTTASSHFPTLTTTASEHYPTFMPTTSDGSGDDSSHVKHKKLGVIVSLSVVIPLVVIGIIIAGIIIYRKSKGRINTDYDDKSQSIETKLINMGGESSGAGQSMRYTENL